MTRKKQINKAAEQFLADRPKQYFHTKAEENTAHTGFIMGAKWADEHQKSPWISVNERLPEEMQMVFVHYEGGAYDCVIYENGLFRRSLQIKFGMKDDGHTTISWFQYFKSNITHWMPIPELIKEE
jgi:hypothetical protein